MQKFLKISATVKQQKLASMSAPNSAKKVLVLAEDNDSESSGNSSDLQVILNSAGDAKEDDEDGSSSSSSNDDEQMGIEQRHQEETKQKKPSSKGKVNGAKRRFTGWGRGAEDVSQCKQAMMSYALNESIWRAKRKNRL